MKMSRFQKYALMTMVAALGLLPLTAMAHDGKHPDAPNPSPNASVTQDVGYKAVTLKYARPGVKGREGKIWGELVPTDGEKLWAGGANGSTIITFEEDVKLNGQDLAAGSYGMFMLPRENDWVIIFSNDSSRFGIMKHKDEEDALRLEVTPEEAAFQEWLSYEFVKTGQLTAVLSLHWENLRVGFTIEAPDHRKAGDDD